MKRVVFVLIVLLLLVSLGACVRSKSTESQLPPESGPGADATPEVEGDVLQSLDQFVTQTAMASEGGSKAVEEETSLPEVGESTDVESPSDETGTGEAQPGENTTDETAPGTEPEATEVVVELEPTATPEPTSPPVVEVPDPTPGIPKTHTIQKGESVYCISRRYDLNPSEVMSINGLASGTLLNPGDVLKIPQTGNPFPGNRALHSHPDTYTVSSGESLYEIACYYGDVDPLVIASVNNISAPYGLTPGTQLQIP